MLDTKEQQDLIQTFEATFNRIDSELRKRTNLSDDEPFSNVLKAYQRKVGGWPYAYELSRIAKLRNAIVHEKKEAYQYIATPTNTTVEKLKGIEQNLLHPKTAYSEFCGVDVVKVQTQQTLDDVLKQIYHLDFSQFPVYAEKRFVGLLTENGITRWLADYAQNHDSLLELKDATVESVLGKEEERANFMFVARSTTLDEIVYAFRTKPDLEAVFVTEKGKEHEGLLGIATRWDITSKSS